MAYVYLLYVYDDDGPQRMVATLDRSQLMSLARQTYHYAKESWLDEAEAGLTELLQKSDTDLSLGAGWPCMHGWGGLRLSVLRLS